MGQGNNPAIASGGSNFIALAYDTQNTTGFGSTVSAIMFAASTDSGRTWSTPVTVVNDGDLNASPAIAADHLNRVWVSWWDGNSSVIKISQTQGGGGFLTPVVIAPTSYIVSGLGQIASNSLAIDGNNGTLYDAMAENNGGSNPLLMRSTDGGTTWSPGATFSSTDPGPPAVAVDGSGRLYLASFVDGAGGESRVISYSSDGGLTFTASAPTHTSAPGLALQYGPGSLVLSPDGSTFADFGLSSCPAPGCPIAPQAFVDLGTFGQSSGFQEQALVGGLGTFYPIGGFFEGINLLGLALGPPAVIGGAAQFDLVQATPGGPVLSWPLGFANVQQVFAVGNSGGAVFATRQSFNPGSIVPGYCQ